MPDFHNFAATHNCLAGCVNDYFVKPLRGSSEEDPGRAGIDVENYAPFISIRIGDSDALVTVGNKSYPPYNTAAIKSIDFGWIDENKGTAEIIDEEGGKFSLFLDALQKCASRVGPGTIIYYKIGWVYIGCGERQGGKIESPEFSSMLGQIEVNYGPMMKYRLNFSTMGPLVFDHRHPKTWGEEGPGKDMKLEDAITQLCEGEPPVIKVKFAWYDQSGTLQYGSHDWDPGGKGGPKASWKGDRQNKYSTISRWIQGFKIKDGKDGKGAILIHDPKVPDQLLVLRSPGVNPGEQISEGPLHLGTYIVNGGKCSNVIEFSPKFNFINAFSLFSSGGGTSGGIKSTNIRVDDYKEPGTEAEASPDAGVQQQTTITTENYYVYGKNAPEQANKARLKHIKANELVGVQVTPITADLKIIGDPRPEFFGVIAGRRVSIVVINPNHLQGGDEQSCGDWLKKSDCNVFLSNKLWLVKGINHSVQEGSYVTTLRLLLLPPGFSNAEGENLGANASGKPLKNEC